MSFLVMADTRYSHVASVKLFLFVIHTKDNPNRMKCEETKGIFGCFWKILIPNAVKQNMLNLHRLCLRSFTLCESVL